MFKVRLLLLISILILVGGVTSTNLKTYDTVLATELNCDTRIQSGLRCHLGSSNEYSFATATAKTVRGENENENHDIVIDASDNANDISVTISEGNEDNANPNIESRIPSTINAIPFP
jgi:hypothetical protein